MGWGGLGPLVPYLLQLGFLEWERRAGAGRAGGAHLPPRQRPPVEGSRAPRPRRCIRSSVSRISGACSGLRGESGGGRNTQMSGPCRDRASMEGGGCGGAMTHPCDSTPPRRFRKEEVRGRGWGHVLLPGTLDTGSIWKLLPSACVLPGPLSPVPPASSGSLWSGGVCTNLLCLLSPLAPSAAPPRSHVLHAEPEPAQPHALRAGQ